MRQLKGDKMKHLLITVLFTLSTIATVQAFADAGEWNEMKTLCKAGAINNQDRAHKPKVNCTYSEQGGFYKENTVETLVINRHVVDPTNKKFTATFSTDKSKSDRVFFKDSYVEGTDKSKEPEFTENSKCTNYKYTKNINFVYQKADTCKLMMDQPTPKTFCDHVYNNVFSDQERQAYTKKVNDNVKECLSEKDGKY